MYNNLCTSNKDHWRTPQWLFDLLDKEFNFDLDPCGDSKHLLRRNLQTITPEGIFYGDSSDERFNDGLTQNWNTRIVFVNPPFTNKIDWIDKCYNEGNNGATVVLLIPCSTDTKWWHNYVMKCTEIRFIEGRITFDGAEGPAPFPSCIVVYHGRLWPHSAPAIRSISFPRYILP